MAQKPYPLGRNMKTGVDLAHFGLNMVFEGTTGVYERIYRFISKWDRKKEKYANSKWIFKRNVFVVVLF